MPVQYKKSRGFGEIDDNYTTGTLIDNTALTITITVPSGEIWLLYHGNVVNGDDVTRAITVWIENESNKKILYLTDTTNIAATGNMNYPNGNGGLHSPLNMPIPLKAGWKIKILYAAGGTSSGGTAEVTAIVEKFKV